MDAEIDPEEIDFPLLNNSGLTAARSSYPPPRGPAAAGGLALARRLDLDDVGAQVGEVHRAERRRHGLGEVDDPEALERLHAPVNSGARLAKNASSASLWSRVFCSRAHSPRSHATPPASGRGARRGGGA